MTELSAARERMIRDDLERRGIRSPAVIAAMRAVPRERFVATDPPEAAYADHPLPIGLDQTISQPYIVAVMLQAAAIGPTSRVLDVGTGSGYAAAVAAEIAAEVVSIERRAGLATTAGARMAAFGYGRVRVLHGDGTLGWPEAAPYDAVIAAAAGPDVPRAWVDQLAAGGRIVMPVAGPRGGQDLVVLSRGRDGALSRRVVEPVVFVPLIGEQGYAE